jgi:hypothetical protein
VNAQRPPSREATGIAAHHSHDTQDGTSERLPRRVRRTVEDDPFARMFPSVAATGVPLDVPGGCDHCDAFQRVRIEARLMWSITVMHDDDCPWFIAYEARHAS